MNPVSLCLGSYLRDCLHLLDEELGGTKGMKEFVKSNEFRKMNVGFGLDEGITSPDESFVVAYGERAIWRKRA